MKNAFYGYYPPTSEEYECLWKEALIVLDTNILLNLYRLPTTARHELINVLDTLKDRLWIPHHVALEFQRRRLTVISAERKSIEDALSAVSRLVDETKKKVDALQIDKRGLGINSQPLISELDNAKEQLIAAITTAHNSQLDISASDPIRQRLDELFESRVGVGPQSQEELDLLVSDGEERFKEKSPPGFLDVEKDKNPNEATFIFDRIKYQRKFGDLILWRQLIQHAKTSNIKNILLITADRKEDWWWQEQGKTIGPHPELIREIQRESGVELFWMYSSTQFVEHANEYLTANVSEESVSEIEQVAMSSPINLTYSSQLISYSNNFPNQSGSYLRERYVSDRINHKAMEQYVGEWLAQCYGTVAFREHGFPDFLVHTREAVHGYEVKYIRDFGRMLVSPIIINSILRGYMETKEGRLSAFTLIMVISEKDFLEIIDNNRISELSNKLGHLLKKYPIHSIAIGAILGEKFECLMQRDVPISDEDFLS